MHTVCGQKHDVVKTQLQHVWQSGWTIQGNVCVILREVSKMMMHLLLLDLQEAWLVVSASCFALRSPAGAARTLAAHIARTAFQGCMDLLPSVAKLMPVCAARSIWQSARAHVMHYLRQLRI